MLGKFVTISGIVMLAAATLPADFSYQETSTITGGMIASMIRVAGVFSKAAPIDGLQRARYLLV